MLAVSPVAGLSLAGGWLVGLLSVGFTLLHCYFDSFFPAAHDHCLFVWLVGWLAGSHLVGLSMVGWLVAPLPATTKQAINRPTSQSRNQPRKTTDWQTALPINSYRQQRNQPNQIKAASELASKQMTDQPITQPTAQP